MANETRKQSFLKGGFFRKLNLAIAGLAAMAGVSSTSLAQAQSQMDNQGGYLTAGIAQMAHKMQDYNEKHAYVVPMEDPTGKHHPYVSAFENQAHSVSSMIRHAFTGDWNAFDEAAHDKNKLENFRMSDYTSPDGEINPVYADAPAELKAVANHNAFSPNSYYKVLEPGAENGERIALRESGILTPFGGVRKIEEVGNPAVFAEMNNPVVDGKVDTGKIEMHLSDAALANPSAVANFTNYAAHVAENRNVNVTVPASVLDHGVSMAMLGKADGSQITFPLETKEAAKLSKDHPELVVLDRNEAAQFAAPEKVVDQFAKADGISSIISNKDGILGADNLSGSVTLSDVNNGTVSVIHADPDGKSYDLQLIKGDIHSNSFASMIHAASMKAITDGMGLKVPEEADAKMVDISKVTGVKGQVVAMTSKDAYNVESARGANVRELPSYEAKEHFVRTPADIAREAAEINQPVHEVTPTQVHRVDLLPEQKVHLLPIKEEQPVHLNKLQEGAHLLIDQEVTRAQNALKSAGKDPSTVNEQDVTVSTPHHDRFANEL